jgi:hypothetical protein
LQGTVDNFRDGLAAEMFIFESRPSLGSLSEVKGACYHHLDLALIDQFRDLLQLGAIWLRGVPADAREWRHLR